jgi:prefoldin subunit 5
LHWEAFTRNNLAIAEQERDASRRMRENIEQLLTATARAMRSQADVVEISLERRIDELDECRQALEDELNQVYNQC